MCKLFSWCQRLIILCSNRIRVKRMNPISTSFRKRKCFFKSKQNCQKKQQKNKKLKDNLGKMSSWQKQTNFYFYNSLLISRLSLRLQKRHIWQLSDKNLVFPIKGTTPGGKLETTLRVLNKKNVIFVFTSCKMVKHLLHSN